METLPVQASRGRKRAGDLDPDSILAPGTKRRTGVKPAPAPGPIRRTSAQKKKDEREAAQQQAREAREATAKQKAVITRIAELEDEIMAEEVEEAMEDERPDQAPAMQLLVQVSANKRPAKGLSSSRSRWRSCGIGCIY